MVHNIIAVPVKLCGQMRLGHCHSYGHCHSGAQRSRGGLNTNGVSVFRMSGRFRAELTEIFQIFQCYSVSEKVQKGVQHSGAMSAGQNESVPVFPFRVFRIVV